MLEIKTPKVLMDTQPFKNNFKDSTLAGTEAPWNSKDYYSENNVPQITSKQVAVNLM